SSARTTTKIIARRFSARCAPRAGGRAPTAEVERRSMKRFSDRSGKNSNVHRLCKLGQENSGPLFGKNRQFMPSECVGDGARQNQRMAVRSVRGRATIRAQLSDQIAALEPQVLKRLPAEQVKRQVKNGRNGQTGEIRPRKDDKGTGTVRLRRSSRH